MPPNHVPSTAPRPESSPADPFVLVGDRLHPADAPVLRADDRGFLFGDGVFETIRVVDGRPVYLERHLNRLSAALRALAIRPLDGRPLAARIDTLLTANASDRDERALRITISRGAGGDPSARAVEPTVVISTRRLGPTFLRRRAGIELRTVDGPARALGHLKSLCYLPSIVAQAAVEPGEEPLLVDPQGAVLEGATCNVFARFGARLVTPADGRLLPGIARALLLERAPRIGLRPELGRLTPDDLQSADEVWLTNALLPLAPAVTLDGRALKSTDATASARALLDGEPP